MLLNTLILGLGNPILGDDGVGWRIVEELCRLVSERNEHNRTLQSNEKPVEFDCAALSGLSLMERVIGYHRVLLVDAVMIPELPVGEVVITDIQNLTTPISSRLASAHDTTLPTALAIGRQLGAQLPTEIGIVGVNIIASFDFSDSLSQEVEAAIPEAVRLALDWLSFSTTRQEICLPGIQVK